MATDFAGAIATEAQQRPGELPSRAAPAVVPGKQRLESLDSFRGFTMFWITGGGALARALQNLEPNAFFGAAAYQLQHTPWVGLRFWDCIWPSFLLMVGVSIPLAVAKRSKTETYAQMLGHAVKRSVILFLLGSLVESIHRGAPYWIELGVLQGIGIAYLAAFLLVRTSPRIQATAGALILAVYAIVLAFASAPGVPAASYQPTTNLARYIDLVLLGRADATENWTIILCWLPAIAFTILGMLIGKCLMSARSNESKAKWIAGVGVLCLAAGYALSPFVPVIMKLVTSSYVLVSAGWACLMFGLFYWTIDVRGHRRWSFPFVVIGSNAIFIYMISEIVPLRQWAGIFSSAMAGSAGGLEPILRAMVVLAVEWLLLFWMYRNRVFIRI
jgi:predicted acyltransferase